MTTATQTRERPILFSGEMVRAILAGRKTQTRRVIARPPWARGRDIEIDEYGMAICFDGQQETHAWLRCPFANVKVDYSNRSMRAYYEPGMRLWVRETFAGPFRGSRSTGEYRYRATNADEPIPFRGSWKPSIFMPRHVSRLTLEVSQVRVERLQKISEADALAEGLQPLMSSAGYLVIEEGGSSYEIGEDFIHGIPKVGDVGLRKRVSHVEHRPQTQLVSAIDKFRGLWEQLNGPRGFGWESDPFVWVVCFRRLAP